MCPLTSQDVAIHSGMSIRWIPRMKLIVEFQPSKKRESVKRKETPPSDLLAFGKVKFTRAVIL
jgi:hypothetical protein